MADLASLRVIISGSVEKLKKSLEDVTSEMFKLSRSTQRIGTALTQGLTVPLAGVATAAVKMSMDFNRSMGNIATLIPENTARVEELKDVVQDLAVEMGKSTKDVAGGMYEILSAIGDSADTTELLAINVKTASAGLATVNETVKFTTAVTKGYGDTTAAATQKVADLGAKAVEIGQTTFPELAASIGQVVPVSVALGVSQEELFAIMGTFSGVTGDASLVTTQLRSALTGLLDPSKELQALLDKLGVSSGKALIEQYGLAGAIQVVTRSAEMSDVPLPKMLGRVEAVTLALALSGKQADAYAQNLDKMNNAAGTVDKQFKAQTQGISKLAFQFDQLRSRVQVLAQNLGDALSPGVEKIGELAGFLIGQLETLVKWFGQLDPSTRAWTTAVIGVAAAIGPVLFAVGKLAAVFANLWPLLKLVASGFMNLASAVLWLTPILVKATIAVAGFVLNLSKIVVTAAISGLQTLASVIASTVIPAIASVGRALIALVISSGPIGLTIAAVGAVVLAWYKWDEIKQIVADTYNAIKAWMGDKLGALWETVKAGPEAVSNAFRSMYEAVVGHSFVPDMVAGIQTEFGKLGKVMLDPAVYATNAVSAEFERLRAMVLSKVVELVSNVASQFQRLKEQTVKDTFAALLSGGPGAAFDALSQKFGQFGKIAEEAGGQAKKLAQGVKFTAEEGEKGAKKVERLKDKIAELGDKIDDVAKLNNPTAALVKRIRELLESGKSGSDLANALKAIQKEYSGSEKELKKFEKAFDEANDQVEEAARKTKDLDKRIEDLAKVDKFPKLTKQIQECFGQRNQMSAEEFAERLKKIRDAFVDAGGSAEDFAASLDKVNEKGSGGFLDGLLGSFNSKFTADAMSGFAEKLGEEVFSALSDAVSDAFENGISKDTFKGLADGLGDAFSAATGIPFIGDFYSAAIKKIIDADFGTGGGVWDAISAGLDTVFPGIGTVLDAAFGDSIGSALDGILGFSENPETSARNNIVGWLEDQLKKLEELGAKFKIFNEQGFLQDFGTNILAGSDDRFNKPGWAEEWWQTMGQESGNAFNAVAIGLQQMLGITEDVGGQIAVILSENLGGNVDNLRLMVQALGIDTSVLEQSFIDAGNAGTMSWHAVEVALQGLNQVTGEGLVAVGNVEGAMQQLISTGGKGAQSIQALQNLGIEAIESGAKSLEDLKSRLRASGKFTEEQIAAIFQALSQRGITSLEQLAEVSDRTGGGIIADLESLGFKWEEVSGAVAETTDNVKELDTATKNLDGRNVDINVRVHYSESGPKPEGEVANAMGNVFGKLSKLNTFARGGIVSRATPFRFGGGRLGLMGEAGPEAILPLKRIKGELGVAATVEGGGGGGGDVVVNFNIDATNAQAGVETNIEEVLKRYEDRIVGRTIEKIVDRKRRGGAIGNAFR